MNITEIKKIGIGGTIYFTEIPTKHLKYNATPEEVTKANFDKTKIFKELLNKEYNNGRISCGTL